MDSEATGASEPLHFKNPPIVEAVIAIDFFPQPEGLLERFQSLQASMEVLGYKTPTLISYNQFQMKIDAGVSMAETRDTRHGWRYDSADGLHVAQFTRTGFIFSRLGKYETWDSFRGEARKAWELYSAEVGSVQPVSYGVRYINKVFVPIDEEISLYLQIYPMLPKDIPQTILESFMRLGMPLKNPDGHLTHQQILLPTEKENHATVILDNDFKFPAVRLTSQEVWDSLEKVRQVKDDYFRKFVTEKLMEGFNA